jgi:Flp pilus assembly protein TadG
MHARVLPSLFRLLRCENSGNVAVIFALAVIPMLLFMGGALDIVRYNRYKWELSNIVDAAAVALGREGNDVTEAEAEAFLQARIGAFGVDDRYFNLSAVNVEETDTGFMIDVHGTMDAIFLPLADGPDALLPEMQVDLVSEVIRASNRLELALVLDNTGSMNCAATVSSACTGNWSNPGSTSRIAGLKAAAHSLVDSLMTPNAEEPDFIKIAVVPFEGTVNIGAAYAANPPWWVDWSDQAKAKYTGRNVASYDFGGAIGVQRVGHKWLFDRLTASNASVKWEGCVMMRAEPYDLTDDPPAAGTPNTLFVPFFWPDEPDDDNDSGQVYQNNYLLDATTSDGAAAQTNVAKFVAPSWQSAADTSFPFTSGPNYGCPRPILPLTNNKTAIGTAIDNMVAYPAMGTFIPNGLIWGWHVLSPTEPFTEAVGPANDLYDDTIKAIVLLSDGENSIAGTSNHNRSVFNGYNYTGLQVNGAYRLGSSNASTATTNLNAKTATLCQNVKAARIRLYTITFGTIPTAAKDLMRNCASVYKGETLYYHAPSNEDLASAFNEIGKHLNELHVAR